MGQPQKLDVLDLGGGIVDGLPSTQILDDQFRVLENFYPFGTKIVRRNGSRRVTAFAYDEQVVSTFTFKRSTGEWLLLAQGLTSLAKKDGDALVTLPPADVSGYTSDDHPGFFRQYQNEGLFVRPNMGTLKRVTEDLIQDAGIAAPDTAMTIADGGAGAITAGDYYEVYTYYNTRTGAESNPSPVSALLTLGASKRIAASNIGVSSNGQVDARRLYRTLPGQAGEYYFVAQINDNVTTTYDDNVIVDDLGSPVSFDNGLPPDDLKCLELWNERAWVHDGRDVMFSEPGLPQSFGEDSVISVNPDDGHSMTALHAFGDRIILAKTNGVHYVQGTDRSDFALSTLSDRHGCVSAHSMKSAEGILIWFGGDNFYRSDGNNVEAISIFKVRRLVDRIPAALYERVHATIWPSKSQYRVSIPVDDDTENSIILVYNYKTDAWSTETYPLGVQTLGDFFDEQEAQILYATMYDEYVYQLDYGNRDFGTPIQARFRTKDFMAAAPGLFKVVRRFWLQMTSTTYPITLKVYNDQSETAAKTRVVELSGVARMWKRINLSTLGKPGSSVGFEGLYTGDTPIEIEALAMELETFRRMGRTI